MVVLTGSFPTRERMFECRLTKPLPLIGFKERRGRRERCLPAESVLAWSPNGTK